MLLELFVFEFRYQLKQPINWLMCMVFAGLGWSVHLLSPEWVGIVGARHIGAPVNIALFSGALNVFALLSAGALVASSVLRDAEYGMADVFTLTNARPYDYVVGRAAGVGGVCGLFFLAAVSGHILACFLGEAPSPVSWLEQGLAYGWGLLFISLPSLLLTVVILTLVAFYSRSLGMVYGAAFGFFVLWNLSSVLLAGVSPDIQSNATVLVDPFGIRAVIKYGAPVLRGTNTDTAFVPLTGAFLLNRLAWLMLPIAALVAVPLIPRRAPAKAPSEAFSNGVFPASPIARYTLAPTLEGVRSSVSYQVWQLFKFNLKSCVTGLPFYILLMLAVFVLLVNCYQGVVVGETVRQVSTAYLVAALARSCSVMPYVLMALYASELVFKDASTKFDEISGAYGVSLFARFCANYLVLLALLCLFMLGMASVSALIFLLWGVGTFEPRVYFKGTGFGAVGVIFVGWFALSVQEATRRRSAAYLSVLGLLILQNILTSEGGIFRLLAVGWLPAMPYSSTAGFGGALSLWAVLALYWMTWIFGFGVVGCALASSHERDGWKLRIHGAKRVLQGRTGVFLVVMLLAGGSIGLWLSTVDGLGFDATRRAAASRQARYELAYKQFQFAAQPRVHKITVEVALYPEKRTASIKGVYRVVNDEPRALDTLYVTTASRGRTSFPERAGHTVVVADAELGFFVLRLITPLAPGEAIDVPFDVNVDEGLSLPDALSSGLQPNGIILASTDYFPQWGYVASRELEGVADRARERLPGKRQFAKDPSRHSVLGDFSDAVGFETTVSTSLGQIAVAPGTLVKAWSELGRSYFHYASTGPMIPYFCFVSANFQPKVMDFHSLRVEWYGTHSSDASVMMQAVRDSADYFSTHFGEMTQDTIKLVAAPPLGVTAKSFPGMAVFSDDGLFAFDLTSKESLASLLFLIAHEVSHQWWGGQLLPADTAGALVLTETLAQYSALMVVESRLGSQAVKAQLGRELALYFHATQFRGSPDIPLANIRDQPVLAYHKGALLMYQLRNTIGAEPVNQALRNLLNAYRLKSAPYATVDSLVAELKAVTPERQWPAIVRIFYEAPSFARPRHSSPLQSSATGA